MRSSHAANDSVVAAGAASGTGAGTVAHPVNADTIQRPAIIALILEILFVNDSNRIAIGRVPGVPVALVLR